MAGESKKRRSKPSETLDKDAGEFALTPRLNWSFLKKTPPGPGVYRIYGSQSLLIYVGKAKNLRRRLSQYKNVKRRRKHRRMGRIIQEAERIEFESCDSELAAELQEVQLIQSHRPKWNIVSAFYFLYPMLGLKWEGKSQDHLLFCYTTHPENYPDFLFHGAYRSREITQEAFFAIVKLLKYVGHPMGSVKERRSRHSYLYGFRNLSEEWMNLWSEFLKGHSRQVLEVLILSLVENAGAREERSEIQELLEKIKRFWNHEAIPLYRARTHTGFSSFPVSQLERDQVFIRYRHLAADVKHEKLIISN